MKRGQAAFEFLITYGWAIVIVLAAIGALAYFGVFRAATLLPDSCMPTPGFGCDSPMLNAYNITFAITNGLGSSVNNPVISKIGNFNCDLANSHICERGITNCITNVPSIASGGIAIVSLPCTLTAGQYVKGDVDINFDSTGLLSSTSFSIRGKVQ